MRSEAERSATAAAGLLRARRVATGHDDLKTGAGETERGFKPDPGARPSDERDAIQAGSTISAGFQPLGFGRPFSPPGLRENPSVPWRPPVPR